MTKFRAVWEDSDDTEVDDVDIDDDESLVEITTSTTPKSSPIKVDKGKGRAVEPDDGMDDEDERGFDNTMTTGHITTKAPPHARALVPDSAGNFVHPHEKRRDSTGTPEDGDSISGSDKENDPTLVDKPIPWPARIGVEPQRVHVMQQSFFHTGSSANGITSKIPASSSNNNAAPKTGLSSLIQSTRKHPRSRESMSVDPAVQRSSFAKPLFPSRPPPPARKFMRIPESQRLTKGLEGKYSDLGLAMGRSFRVGWGVGGLMVFGGGGRVCSVEDLTKFDDEDKEESATVVNIHRLQMSSHSNNEEATLSNNLLSTLSSHSTIDTSSPSPSAQLLPSLDFSSFTSFANSTTATYEETLFRLCSALFDPSPDLDAQIAHLPPETQSFIKRGVWRKERVGAWLEGAVRRDVEADLRKLVLEDKDKEKDKERESEKTAKKIYTLLSGNQVERACDEALDGRFVHLATLLAQAGGGEAGFREELDVQLEIWRDEGLGGDGKDTLLGKWVGKVYEVLAGRVSVENPARDADHDLDWKRVLGMRLWFGERIEDDGMRESGVQQGEDDIQSVMKEYEILLHEERVPIPAPWYLSSSASPCRVAEAQYLLLQLFASSSSEVSNVLHPLSYSRKPLDARLPFFIGMLLQQYLRHQRRSQRQQQEASTGMDVDMREDTSQDLDTDRLVVEYASLLESVASIKEACFVLLFLTDPVGRKKAVTELLSRHAMLFEAEGSTFKEDLKLFHIPDEWMHEAEATSLLYSNAIYEGYESALLSRSPMMVSLAHNIAVNQLAPEIVLRGDMRLLRHIFARFAPFVRDLEGWSVRGKLYLEYANAIILLDEQAAEREREQSENTRPAVPDAVEASEIARLALELPKLIPLFSDIAGGSGAEQTLMQRAAVERMSNELLKRQTQLEGLGVNQEALLLRKGGLGVDDGTRMHYVKAKAVQMFLTSVDAAAS